MLFEVIFKYIFLIYFLFLDLIHLHCFLVGWNWSHISTRKLLFIWIPIGIPLQEHMQQSHLMIRVRHTFCFRRRKNCFSICLILLSICSYLYLSIFVWIQILMQQTWRTSALCGQKISSIKSYKSYYLSQKLWLLYLVREKVNLKIWSDAKSITVLGSYCYVLFPLWLKAYYFFLCLFCFSFC